MDFRGKSERGFNSVHSQLGYSESANATGSLPPFRIFSPDNIVPSLQDEIDPKILYARLNCSVQMK